MKRRDFLKYSLYATAMMGTIPSFGVRVANAAAIPGASPFGRTLVNIMLLGGADLRFLFAPAPGSAVADKYWEVRRAIYQSTAADRQQYQIGWAQVELSMGVDWQLTRTIHLIC